MLKNSKVLNAERLLVLVSITICLLLCLNQSGLGVDRKIYDTITQLLDEPLQADDIALIAVDDRSVEGMGRWPWSRSVHAELIAKLKEVSPKLIVANFLFSEQERKSNSSDLQRIQSSLLQSQTIERSATDGELSYQPGQAWLNADFISPEVFNRKRNHYLRMQGEIIASLAAVDQEISAILNQGSADNQLEESLRGSVPILMPLQFNASNGGADQGQAPEYLTKKSVSILVQGDYAKTREAFPVNMDSVILPITKFGERTYMMGHINDAPDSDGKLRTHQLLINHKDRFYPSLALAAHVASLGLTNKDILFMPGIGVVIDGVKYFSDEKTTIMPNINFGRDDPLPFTSYSYTDILSKTTGLEDFRDKVVVLGITAHSLSTQYKTANARYLSSSELLATNIANLSHLRFYHTPPWLKAFVWLLFGIAAVLLLMFCKRMGMRDWVVLLVTSVVVLLGVQYIALKQVLIWPPFSPLYMLLCSAFILINIWTLLSSERVSFQNQIESNESNRVLGLTYQNQGQLDLAFDKFRRCTPDDSIVEALYGLGLDFERKRLTHKAGLVYQYIESIKPSYRDVPNRICVIVGDVEQVDTSESDHEETLINSKNNAKLEQPTFGRYQAEREIGRGGMGAVYLGRDPKIDRVVAIKTLDFFAAFSGELLVEAKSRFAREAIAIGKLNHPNIVTVYDAGEEHDVAYIAMEYLRGQDLSKSVPSENMLTLQEVIEIGIACADALNYAHNLGVIHRDVKPSNIIYDRITQKTILTDFGIALLLNAESEKTHSAIGSPYYMSPEQVKGEELDGRSDIYSLAVSLFELLTSKKPYNGDNVAAISYAIVNSPVPKISEVKENMPAQLDRVILKAMQKQKQRRFSTAIEMKKALEACRA